MNRFIATTLFFLLSLCFFSFYSQDNNPLIVIAGSVNDENYIKLNGVKVEVKQDDKIFKSVLTTSKGKYLSMKLPFGYIYRVTFSKDKLSAGILQEYDDFDNNFEFDNVNSYSNARVRRKKEIFLLPLERVNSSKSYTHFQVFQ